MRRASSGSVFTTTACSGINSLSGPRAARAMGKRKAGRSILCEDRDNPGRYLQIVFFESYEAAMENSAMPETDALSKKMMTFAEGPPTFYNLNVIDDRE